MTWPEIVAASVIIGFATLVQALVGFGLNLVAAPLLLLVDPHFLPAPATIAGLCVTSMMWHREREHADLTVLGWGTVARVPGALVGAILLTRLPRGGLDVVVGVLILLSLAVTLTRVNLEPRRATVVGACFLAGVFTSVASVGGPPLAIVYQRSSGAVIRSTLAMFGVVGAFLSLASLWFVGELGRRELLLGMALAPAVVIGFRASRRFTGAIDTAGMRHAIVVLCAGSSATLIVRGAL